MGHLDAGGHERKTSTLEARAQSSSKELSFKRSKPEPCNKSSGSNRQSPNAAAAEETGAEAPQKRSTNMRQGGNGLAPGGMHVDAAPGAQGVDVCIQASGPEEARGCGLGRSWAEEPATACEGAGRKERELEDAGGTGRCTDTACVSHCSTIVKAAAAEIEGTAAGESLAGGRQAGRLKAGDPGKGGTEGEVQTRSPGAGRRYRQG